MNHENFAVFILSHGRPDSIETIKTLNKGNYTGKWYIVIDNEDETANEYFRLYGSKVIMFDKLEISKRFDTADNFDDRRTVVYARNACFDIAKSFGIDYFLELDDDYDQLAYRKEIDGVLTQRVNCYQLDRLFDLMIDFLEKTRAKTVAFAQGGDFIGGVNSGIFQDKLKRKAMNTLFCKTKNPFQFVGRINEDVNTYTALGQKGELFFTIADVFIHQIQTQSNAGGMTDVYLNSGTYVKSFYSVIFNPSCVKIAGMGTINKRIHHRISWNNCVPKILNQKYKK